MCIDHSLHCRQRLNSIPLFHNLLKEYVKEAMKKGTYKEVDYQPMTLIQYDIPFMKVLYQMGEC